MTILKNSLIAFLISANSFASEFDLEQMQHRKGFYTLVAIAHDQPASVYLETIKDIPNSAELQVSVKQFNELLQRASGQITNVANRSHLKTLLREFIASNALTPAMVGNGPLKTAENNFINIIILLEFQKMISTRRDLPSFGKGTIENLNYSINETVQIFLKIAEMNLSKVLYNKEAAYKMRNNFLNKGLAYSRTLTRSERWVNEYLGRDPNFIPNLSLEKALEERTNDNVALTNRKLRASLFSICTTLFS